MPSYIPSGLSVRVEEFAILPSRSFKLPASAAAVWLVAPMMLSVELARPRVCFRAA